MNQKQMEIYERIEAISEADDLINRASEYPDYYNDTEVKKAKQTRSENMTAILEEFE